MRIEKVLGILVGVSLERVCEFVRGGESERDEIAGVGVGLGSSGSV